MLQAILTIQAPTTSNFATRAAITTALAMTQYRATSQDDDDDENNEAITRWMAE